MPSTPDDDPLAAFELPPELMTSTLEHAISDDATMIDVERTPGAIPVTLDVTVPIGETDPVRVAERLAKALRKY